MRTRKKTKHLQKHVPRALHTPVASHPTTGLVLAVWECQRVVSAAGLSSHNVASFESSEARHEKPRKSGVLVPS